MFQPSVSVRQNNTSCVNADGQQNMYPISYRPLPREVQYNNDLPQHVDTEMRRSIFQPSLMQLPNGVVRNTPPPTILSTAGPSGLQAQSSAYPGTSRQVSPAVNLNSSNVNAHTSANGQRNRSNSFVTSEVNIQQKNYLPMTSAVNNSTLVPYNRTKDNASTSTSTDQNLGNAVAATGNLNVKIFGSTESEKFFVFTGTVERVIKWNRIFQNHFCFFEVIASVVSIQEGSMRSQKIMLLRDKRGPILQVIYYNITTHLDIEDFHVGQVLRCVGKMSAPNILNAVSIRSATQGEIETLQRLCLICDHAVSHFLNA